jgi:copper transport protein
MSRQIHRRLVVQWWMVIFPLALLMFLLFPQMVSADAILLRSDPGQGSILLASPSQIQMWFSQDLNPAFSTVYVVNAANSTGSLQNDSATHVDKGDAHVSITDAKEMDVSLKPHLPSAVYIVFYRMQSAQDGRILYGSFAFTVTGANGNIPTFNGSLPQQGAFSASSGASGQIDGHALFSLIMITLVDLGTLFWVGAQFWRVFVLSELHSEDQNQQAILEQMEQRFDYRFSGLILLLILLANIGVLAGQTLTLTGNQWEQAFVPLLLFSLVAHGQFGTFWIMRQIVILLALLLIAIPKVIKLPARLMTASISWGNFILGLALLIALTLSGQDIATSSTNVQVYGVLGDFLHLVAAALWVGGTIYLAMIYLPILKSKAWQQQATSLLTILPRYLPLVITGVVLMVVSGPLEAATRLLAWDQLSSTAYGRILIVKTLLVGAMLLIGAIDVLLVRPRLAKDFTAYQRATEATQEVKRVSEAEQPNEQKATEATQSSQEATQSSETEQPNEQKATEATQSSQEAAQTSETEQPTELAPTPVTQAKEQEDGIAQQMQKLGTILRWQAALGVAVLLCTGLLAVFSGTLQQTAIGQSASQPQNAPPKPLNTTVETTDRQFHVTININPNQFGANTFTATVTDSQGHAVPISNISSISLYTTMLDMDMGTQEVSLQPDGKGHFSGSGDLEMGGNWQISITVRTADGMMHRAVLKFFAAY